ncbi:MAG: hypothetical protein AAGF12_13140 [Myxococcota bacterium]
MHSNPSTIIVVGASTSPARAWLRSRFPRAGQLGSTLILCRRGIEIDAILWAEGLRQAARRAGYVLSIGVCERTYARGLDETLADAARAFRQARDLGGDYTIAHQTLIQAA